MGSFAGQLKQVLRRLSRSPLFTVITLITLAVGIGANTAIFSVVEGVLLKPLPYPAAERLTGAWHTAPGLGIKLLNASPATYLTYRENNRTFEDIGIWQDGTVSVTGVAEPEQVPEIEVTDGILPMLGVKPHLGRWFTKKDDSPGSPETAILAYGYWQRRFGSDPHVLGRRILVNGRAQEVIGVMPREFRFLDQEASLFLPMRLERSKVFIGNFSFQGIARLKPGVSLAAANADVARMIPMMTRTFPVPPGMNLKMVEEARIGPNVRPLKVDVVGDIGNVLWVLMGTIGIVLFIACANVANLLLVRAEGRQQEFAIRAALGAGWARIARELLFESLALGIAGGALGLGLAGVALRLLVAHGPANLPRINEISIDLPVLLFTLLISVVAGAVFGLVPAIKYGGPRVGMALREGGRSISEGRERHRTRGVLVVVQVALALVLLVSSGLMFRTLQALRQVQPGFVRPNEILTLRISIPEAQVPEPARVIRMHNDIVQKLADISGVESVGLSNSITMDGSNNNDPIFVSDRQYDEGKIPPMRRFKFVSPNYFRTVGNPLLAGRDLSWTDLYNQSQVVLISENMAREFWPNPAAALGKRLRENPKGQWREIIGVVGNERDDGVNKPAPTIVYWPMVVKQFWGNPVMVRRTEAYAIRSTRTGTSSFMDDVRKAVWSVNPNLPLANVRTVQTIYDRSLATTSFTLTILAIAASMALLLGVVGIYGVISYSVSQRTREIGIRMALGAPREQVRKMFMGHGLKLAGIGVVCGLVAALLLTRLMASLLFEVQPVDPLTYGAVSLVLVAAALVASFVPAQRATGIDPADALRSE